MFPSHDRGGGSKWNNDTYTQSIVNIPQGYIDGERVGTQVIVKEIDIRATMGYDSTYNQDYGSQLFRVIVWQDKQCNGAAPTAPDIMRQVPSAPTQPDVSSAFNIHNENRFCILADKTYTFNCKASLVQTAFGPNPALAGVSKNMHIKICDLDIPINYSGTTGALSEIRSNNIGILYLFQYYDNGVHLYGYTDVVYCDY